jgi:hypothetical protein
MTSTQEPAAHRSAPRPRISRIWAAKKQAGLAPDLTRWNEPAAPIAHDHEEVVEAMGLELLHDRIRLAGVSGRKLRAWMYGMMIV